MTSPRKGLGKGLASLLGDYPDSKKDSSQVQLVDISVIRSNPYQPRKIFREELLNELSESIKANGVIQPILLSRKGDDYYIIAGERRFLAARMAGLSKIPALIRDYNEQQFMIVSLIENIQRDDLTPLEKAYSFKSIVEKLNITHNELSQRLNIDRSNITNHIRLLKLPEVIKESLNRGDISMGHCRALLSLSEEARMIEVFNHTIKSRLSVNQLEKLIKDMARQKKLQKNPKDPNLKNIEQQLVNALNTRVSISSSRDGKGYIRIDYYSKDDFDKIYQRLLSIEQ
jgi:ParB family chromosome partitioning protein